MSINTFVEVPKEGQGSMPVGRSHLPARGIRTDISDRISSLLNRTVQSLAQTHQDWQATKKNWHERAISHLESYDLLLEEKMPNFSFQDKIDRFIRNIKEEFAPLDKFNTWLDSNGYGSWYIQLATFLVKLPLRAVRNIVTLLYDIVEAAIYSATHPLKALNHLAKHMVNLIYELTKPEIWSKIGAGLMGASLGQFAVTGNPFSAIGLGIGAAMLIGGLSIGALQAALEAEDGYRGQAALQNLWSQAKSMPEYALTGFCVGLLMGAISKATAGVGGKIHRESISIGDMFRHDWM